MRITKLQLRRIIREEKARLLEDDKYAQLPPTSHERVTGMPSEFVEDNWIPWLEERGLGAEDLDDLAEFTGAPDRSWLPAEPPADGMDGPADLEKWARYKKTGIKESKIKITKRQLRSIIQEVIAGSPTIGKPSDKGTDHLFTDTYGLGREDSLAGVRPQSGDKEYMRGYNEAQEDAGLPRMQPPSDSGRGKKLDPSKLKGAFAGKYYGSR